MKILDRILNRVHQDTTGCIRKLNRVNQDTKQGVSVHLTPRVYQDTLQGEIDRSTELHVTFSTQWVKPSNDFLNPKDL